MLENRTRPGTSVPARDQQTVTADGEPLGRLVDGMRIRRLRTHVDDRGSIMEVMDPRWGWHDDPLVYAYSFTIRPGAVKGWGLHERHEDRYMLMFGRMELVCYDPREGSPTQGEVCKVVLHEHDRCVVNVPQGVWHADRNVGDTDVVVINFPTIPYGHEAPDKLRLPLDTPEIPYSFERREGW